jgi:hypothetical protein
MAQCMEEASVADPPLLLNQLVMHNGDVSGCTAEADPSQLAPETQRGAKGRSLQPIFPPAACQVPRARCRPESPHKFCNLCDIITS